MNGKKINKIISVILGNLLFMTIYASTGRTNNGTQAILAFAKYRLDIFSEELKKNFA
jgi:hypothetical protein